MLQDDFVKKVVSMTRFCVCQGNSQNFRSLVAPGLFSPSKGDQAPFSQVDIIGNKNSGHTRSEIDRIYKIYRIKTEK